MSEDFDRELLSRLAVLEDPNYDDPARADLPTQDLVLVAVLTVLTVVLMIIWSYPA